jgi:uncharacterized repeat protein (TIGR01451 family)
MVRFRVGLAVAAIAVGVFVFTVGAGAANAASTPIPGGSIEQVCAGTRSGSTFTLKDDCGPVTTPITVPDTITTVNGAGHTISATDTDLHQFNGGILTNESPGQTMHIENLTVSGPPTGFAVSTITDNVLFGIYFNDASGSVNNVKVEHVYQKPNPGSPSSVTGNAIRAANPTAPRTVTITHTTVLDYQKNGIDGRGVGMTMNVSDSTIGPPNNQEGLIAANGLVYAYGGTGTAKHNTIFGSGDQGCSPPTPCTPGTGGATNSIGAYLYDAQNVTITHNTITGDKTDIGVGVEGHSTGKNIISFNTITRTSPDNPDPTGVGIDVYTPDGSSATPICNTFSNWNTYVLGAEQISCTPLPNGNKCQAYSAPAPAVDSGKNNAAEPPSDLDHPPNIIGATPFTWTVGAGTLPPGLSLSSAGVIAGTPTAAGTFKFTMKLVDATGLTARRTQTITIASDCGPPDVITKVPDSPTVTAGGLAGYRITVSNPGRAAARNWWVCDRMPSGLTFVRATRKLRRLGRLRCLVIPTLGPHQRVSFHVTARVASNAQSTLANEAEVIPGPPAGGTSPPPAAEPPIADVVLKQKVRHAASRPPTPPPPVTG